MAGITKQRLKELVKEVMVEETEYQAFFQKALDKAGKSIPSMSDEEKKEFFNKIDSAWNGKGEKSESVVTEAIDINHWKKYANGGGPLFSRKVKTQREFNTEFREVAYAYNNDPDSRENRLKRDKIEKVKKLAQEFFDKEGFITSNIIDEMWSAMVSGKLNEEEIKWNAVEKSESVVNEARDAEGNEFPEYDDVKAAVKKVMQSDEVERALRGGVVAYLQKERGFTGARNTNSQRLFDKVINDLLKN